MKLEHFRNGKFDNANSVNTTEDILKKTKGKKGKKTVYDTRVVEQHRGELLAMNKKINEALVELKCMCPHKTTQGVYRLRKDQNGGEYQYICNTCDKHIDIMNVSENALNDAINSVDRALDQIKMYLSLNDERDIEILKKISKFQFFLITKFGRYYKHTRADGQRAKQNRNNRGPETRMYM